MLNFGVGAAGRGGEFTGFGNLLYFIRRIAI